MPAERRAVREGGEGDRREDARGAEPLGERVFPERPPRVAEEIPEEGPEPAPAPVVAPDRPLPRPPREIESDHLATPAPALSEGREAARVEGAPPRESPGAGPRCREPVRPQECSIGEEGLVSLADPRGRRAGGKDAGPRRRFGRREHGPMITPL